MDTRSIGVFDAGLGGISVLLDIVELMPVKIIYILAIRHTHLTEQRPERLFLRDRSSVPIFFSQRM